MQEMLQGIGRRCKPWHESDALEARNNTSCQLAICSETPTCHAGAANALQHFLVLSRQDIDQAVAHFLQAITARQLWASQPGHDCTVVGIDEHRGLSNDDIVQYDTLRMTADAEELQAQALTAVLPVRFG